MSKRASWIFVTFFLFQSVVLCFAQAQSKRTKSNLKPKESSAFFEFGDEAELLSITDQSIEELRKLIRRFSQSKNRGEFWLRLAELYVEKSRLIEFKEFRKFDRALKRYESGSGRRRPKVQLSGARSYNRKAITLYEKFVRYFPEAERIDQALFFLGFNYFALNAPGKGAVYGRT